MIAPKASLIVLCYKQEAMVARAIEAALAQQGPPLEIIISDDASPDRSFDVINACVANYNGPHHVIVRRNDINLGVNNHINLIVDLARSDLTIWSAADDISAPDRALRVIQAHEATGAALLFSDATTVDEAGRPVPSSHQKAVLYHSSSPTDAARSFALYLGATLACHKVIFQRFGPLPAIAVHEDLILGFRACLLQSLHYIPEKLVTYTAGIGISQVKRADTSREANRQSRIAILEGKRNVVRQRLADARQFGLSSSDPVCRVLERLHNEIDARLHYYGAPGTRFGLKGSLAEAMRDLRKR